MSIDAASLPLPFTLVQHKEVNELAMLLSQILYNCNNYMDISLFYIYLFTSFCYIFLPLFVSNCPHWQFFCISIHQYVWQSPRVFMSLNFFGFYELFPIIIQQAYNIVYRKLGNMYKYLYFSLMRGICLADPQCTSMIFIPILYFHWCLMIILRMKIN